MKMLMLLVVCLLSSSLAGEDCPHHCPSVQSPVCGTGEQSQRNLPSVPVFIQMTRTMRTSAGSSSRLVSTERTFS